MRSRPARKLIRSEPESVTRTAEEPGTGQADHISEQAPSSSQTTPSEISNDRKLKRVLVIDDDDLVLELVKRILESDFEVITASSGSEGLDIIRSTHVDLVLLDWMMPEMDGLSVLISLKADESTQEIPVVFLSGKSERTAIELALASGADDFITKPFKHHDLVKRVGDRLEVS